MLPFIMPLFGRGRIATWNPADKGASIVLSNGNLTATDPGAGQSVRATVGQSAGKWYFEVTIGSAGTSCAVGVATSGHTLSGQLSSSGVSPTSRGYYNDGSGPTNPGSYSGGAIIGVAVDFGASKIWLAKDGTFSGDPAAGTGGSSIPAGTLYPAWSSSGGNGTGHFGATLFNYTPPSGFVGWGR